MANINNREQKVTEKLRDPPKPESQKRIPLLPIATIIH